MIDRPKGGLDPKVMEVKKFRLKNGVCGSHFLNGEFIEHSDHLATVQPLQARIVELEEASRWIAVTERLPENARPVLIYGVNSAGKGRRLRAMYAREFELEAYEEDDTADYSEEKDEYFAKPGWYENNEFEEVHWLIDFPVTHWQPLPKEPK